MRECVKKEGSDGLEGFIYNCTLQVIAISGGILGDVEYHYRWGFVANATRRVFYIQYERARQRNAT
jgi:hypothetical protein